MTTESAQKELRKRGVVLASKKSSRIAAEGLLALAQNKEKAVVVELNCETDFVARNEIFQYIVSATFIFQPHTWYTHTHIRNRWYFLIMQKKYLSAGNSIFCLGSTSNAFVNVYQFSTN